MNVDRMAVALVTLGGVALVGAGLACAVAPRPLLAMAGLHLDSPDALTDVRATYGGLQLGLGIWLLGRCWWRRDLPGALALLGVALASVATIRLLATVIGAAPFWPQGAIALAEGVFAAAAFAVLVRRLSP